MAKKRYRKLDKGYKSTAATIIIRSNDDEINQKAIDDIAAYTGVDSETISRRAKFLKQHKQIVGLKGVKTRVNVGNILNDIFYGQLDNFFFNMGLPVGNFISQVNEFLEKEGLSLIDRNYIENTGNWTEGGKNYYKKYEGNLLLPGGHYIEFDWDYDYGSTWSII